MSRPETYASGVVFVHEGSKMPPHNMSGPSSPAAMSTTIEEAGLRDGSTVFVFDKVG